MNKWGKSGAHAAFRLRSAMVAPRHLYTGTAVQHSLDTFPLKQGTVRTDVPNGVAIPRGSLVNPVWVCRLGTTIWASPRRPCPPSTAAGPHLSSACDTTVPVLLGAAPLRHLRWGLGIIQAANGAGSSFSYASHSFHTPPLKTVSSTFNCVCCGAARWWFPRSTILVN